MEEGDALPLRAEPGRVVDESDAVLPAAVECGIEIVDRKAEMVHAGSASGDELADWRVVSGWGEKLDERVTGGEPGYAGPVGVVQRHDRQAEDVTEKGKTLVEGAHGDADMGDARAARGIRCHQGRPPKWFGGASKVTLSEDQARMSNAIAVTDTDFESQVEKHEGLTVVDFWAAWCGPCRMVGPILDQLAVEFQGKARVTKLDVDANQKTAMRFQVRSIPTILFFKDGKVVDQVIGAVPKAHLEEKFRKHAA